MEFNLYQELLFDKKKSNQIKIHPDQMGDSYRIKYSLFSIMRIMEDYTPYKYNIIM